MIAGYKLNALQIFSPFTYANIVDCSVVQFIYSVSFSLFDTISLFLQFYTKKRDHFSCMLMIPTDAMITIEPAVNVTVSSSHADIIKVLNDWGTLSFEWNTDVANGQSSAGLKIGIPAGQLEDVVADIGYNVIIKDGFTNLKKLSSVSSANLQADLTKLKNDDQLIAWAATSGAFNLKSNRRLRK